MYRANFPASNLVPDSVSVQICWAEVNYSLVKWARSENQIQTMQFNMRDGCGLSSQIDWLGDWLNQT